MALTIKQMVEEKLVAGGYDGLANAGLECGCEVGDLMPCSEPSTCECLPGKKIPGRTGVFRVEEAQ